MPHDPPQTGIPEPPRSVRWRAPLARWWPFGLGVGMSLAILTGVGASLWSTTGGGLPFDDRALDRGAELAEAQVTAVRTTSLELDGRAMDSVRYVFDLGDGKRRFGVSYASRGRFRAGQTADLEYLPDDFEVHRLRGAQRMASSYWLPWFFGWLWLPALLLFLYWVRAVFKLRAVLRDGLVAAAEIRSAKKVLGLNPPHLRVRYSFVDRFGDRQEGGHWVRTGSELGRAVAAAARSRDAEAEPVSVVYGELQPNFNRLVVAADFG